MTSYPLQKTLRQSAKKHRLKSQSLKRQISTGRSGKTQPEEAPSEMPQTEASDQCRTFKNNALIFLNRTPDAVREIELVPDPRAPTKSFQRSELKKHRLKRDRLKHQISAGRPKTTR